MMVYLALAVGAEPEPAVPAPAQTAARDDATSDPPDEADPPARARPMRPGGGLDRVRKNRDRGRTSDDAEPVREPPPPGAANKNLDELMASANKAYDRGDLEIARNLATKALEQAPDNVRMLRVMVSTHCMEGESAEAATFFARLPPADQDQMRARCDRYGVSFK